MNDYVNAIFDKKLFISVQTEFFWFIPVRVALKRALVFLINFVISKVRLNTDQYHKFKKILLIIGGVECNPGPD